VKECEVKEYEFGYDIKDGIEHPAGYLIDC